LCAASWAKSNTGQPNGEAEADRLVGPRKLHAPDDCGLVYNLGAPLSGVAVHVGFEPGEVRMVPLVSLWLPIVLSAVIVFVVSSFIHMVLPFHKGDMRKVPREDEVMAALRPFKIPPGDYGLPLAGSMADMKSPEFLKKMNDGPVIFMTVVPSGPSSMGKSLVLWFLYAIIVSVFAAYIAGRALGPDANYLQVFRFAGCTAFTGYSLALLQQSIWYQRNWGTTLRSMFDGLIYGLLTAGTFGWLWPR